MGLKTKKESSNKLLTGSLKLLKLLENTWVPLPKKLSTRPRKKVTRLSARPTPKWPRTRTHLWAIESRELETQSRMDVGLARTSTGARVFAAMKGACDGGLDV